MKKLMMFLFVFSLITACKNDASVEIDVKEGEKRSKLAAGSQSEEELEKAAEERRKEQERIQQQRLASQTTMEITPKVHDFGLIPKDKPVSTIFTVKNTGKNPLTINDAKASCGCTVPSKPEEPILPGETGELEVTFTAKPNQVGQNITKTITVTANIPNSTQTVTITGKVQD
ncbi:MAG: DUF1573 domain-containing protein [Brumimicrobium sp.]|nr:DUF1573 domain-containing protein [Brumimicrobium sp.]